MATLQIKTPRPAGRPRKWKNDKVRNKYYSAQHAKKRSKRAKIGLCYDCGNKTSGTWRCPPCAEVVNARRRVK